MGTRAAPEWSPSRDASDGVVRHRSRAGELSDSRPAAARRWHRGGGGGALSPGGGGEAV
ncbi:UNVERIFIED_CONTAM: hypothetical protein Sradi_4094100 [Sesamum radiatum]|uniref:Uncharacterized protein n=1 Tax=Sesamum radiatum TaxID=300843 RepID=A0AAW2PMY8_SESRA